MARFKKDIVKFNTETIDRTTLVMKKIVLDVFTRIVKRTRVDTGLARGNWQVGVLHTPAAPIDRKTKGVNKRQALDALSGYDARSENEIYIANPVYYVQWLEEGTENSAGDHMVGRTVEEFRSFVSSIVSIT